MNYDKDTERLNFIIAAVNANPTKYTMGQKAFRSMISNMKSSDPDEVRRCIDLAIATEPRPEPLQWYDHEYSLGMCRHCGHTKYDAPYPCIRENDLQFDKYTASAGNIGRVTHRITHKPTGIAAESDEHASQHKNFQIALTAMKIKLEALFKKETKNG